MCPALLKVEVCSVPVRKLGASFEGEWSTLVGVPIYDTRLAKADGVAAFYAIVEKNTFPVALFKYTRVPACVCVHGGVRGNETCQRIHIYIKSLDFVKAVQPIQSLVYSSSE